MESNVSLGEGQRSETLHSKRVWKTSISSITLLSFDPWRSCQPRNVALLKESSIISQESTFTFKRCLKVKADYSFFPVMREKSGSYDLPRDAVFLVISL